MKLTALVGVALILATAAFAAVTKDLVLQILKAKIDDNFKTSNAKYVITPHSSSARTAKGQFAFMSISADWAEDRDAHFKLTDVYVSAKNVQLDAAALTRDRKIRVLSREMGKCRVRLYETDVNRALSLKDTPIQNLKADFGTGTVTFTGKYTVNIKLTGRLEIRNRSEIWFVPTQASIGILGVPIGIVNKFLGSLNPVIDMRDLPLEPTIKSITVTPAYIDVTG